MWKVGATFGRGMVLLRAVHGAAIGASRNCSEGTRRDNAIHIEQK
jgi:hypothetical protein